PAALSWLLDGGHGVAGPVAVERVVRRRTGAPAVVGTGHVVGLGPQQRRDGLRRKLGTFAGDQRGHSGGVWRGHRGAALGAVLARSEEHTSELQSRENLVCRLLLEKKNHRTAHPPTGRHRRSGFGLRWHG